MWAENWKLLESWGRITIIGLGSYNQLYPRYRGSYLAQFQHAYCSCDWNGHLYSH